MIPSAEPSAAVDDAEGVFDTGFKPLTSDEARQWRIANPAISPWLVVAWQMLAGAVFACLVAAVSGASAAVSAAYGAASVVLPSALMVRGLQRQGGVVQPGAAMVGFVIWELVKIALTVAMLLVAPKVVQPLHWQALVAGFVVTMKAYWVAAWLHSRRYKLNLSN